MRRAFEGADRLRFIFAPTFDSSVRMPQHRNVVLAAREAEVGVLAYTSAGGCRSIVYGSPLSTMARSVGPPSPIRAA